MMTTRSIPMTITTTKTMPMVAMATRMKKNTTKVMTTKINQQGGDSIAQWLAYLLPDPSSSGLIPSAPKFFFRKKLSTFLKLINGTGLRKVDSGLKMLIEAI